jgi:hypothetical protein
MSVVRSPWTPKESVDVQKSDEDVLCNQFTELLLQQGVLSKYIICLNPSHWDETLREI